MARQIIDLTTPQPNGKMGEPTKSAWEKVNDMTLELYGDIESLQVVNPTSISGLGVEWVNGNTLKVLQGSAYIPGISRIAYLASDTNVSISGIPSNTFGHLYLKANGAIESSSVGPEARYAGYARTKIGDTSTRYLFSFRVGGSDIFRFSHSPESGLVLWLSNINSSPFLLVSGQSPTTATSVSAAPVVPITGTSVVMSILNYGTALSYVLVSNSNGPSPPSGYFAVAGPGASDYEIPVDVSRSYVYSYDSAGNSSFHRCRGYRFHR